MAHDAAGPREEGEGLSAQLRYDALVHLVAKWNRATDLDHAARAFAAGLKFVLSLGPFRLAVREGNAFVVVQGTSGELQVLRADGAGAGGERRRRLHAHPVTVAVYLRQR